MFFLRFSAGALSGSFECANVTIINDEFNEPEENFRLSLTDVSNFEVISPSMATVTITDNDPIAGSILYFSY